MPAISTDECDGIAVVRLDRPDRYNALVPELVEALPGALRQAASTARPIILTGAGAAFCAGADLKWLATFDNPGDGVAQLVDRFHDAIRTLWELPVPVISAINGAVAGGGLGLALAVDYRLAAERATFTAGYFRLGLTPDGGSSAILSRTIGAARTLELLLTNRRLSAPTALEWGLVNGVVPDSRLLERAAEVAKHLLAVPPETLLATRRLLDIDDVRKQLEREADAIRTAARQPDFRTKISEVLRG